MGWGRPRSCGLPVCYDSMNTIIFKKTLPLITAALLWSGASAQTRISCVGASITEGYGTSDWKTKSYPGQLQALMGDGFAVSNFGRGGCTMLRMGDCPYWTMEKFRPSLESNPDIVFIDLGGNDAKLRNRIHKEEFVKDACDLIEEYRNLPTHPRVILMTAIPGFTNDSTEIWNKAIVRDINPLIIEAGKRSGTEVLDMHPVLSAHPELLPDAIHPNDKGAGMMARKMADYLKTWPEKPSKVSTIDGVEEINAPVKGVPQFDITWRGLGEDENWSMPLGNGDVAANV